MRQKRRFSISRCAVSRLSLLTPPILVFQREILHTVRGFTHKQHMELTVLYKSLALEMSEEFG